MARLRVAITLLLTGVGAACASTEELALDGGARDASTLVDGGAAAKDGGTGDGSTGPTLEVGTGAEKFELLVDGEGIALNRGPQGGDPLFGFHIWTGVRTHGLARDDLAVAFTVRTATGSVELATGAYHVNLEATADGDVTYGLRAVLSNCCLAERRDLVLRAEVTDTAGQSLADEVRVRAFECPPGLPNPTIDPCP